MPGGKERKRLRAVRARREGHAKVPQGSGRWLMDVLIAAATVVAASAAVASVYVAWTSVRQWELEAEDRKLTRQLSFAQVMDTLNQALQEAGHSDQYPNARFRVGEAIQQLHELDEPTIIIGDNVVIENTDLSCIEGLEIRAPVVELINVQARNSTINIWASDVTLNRTTLETVHLGLLPPPRKTGTSSEEDRPLNIRIVTSVLLDTHLNSVEVGKSSLLAVNTYAEKSSFHMEGASFDANFSYFDDVAISSGSPPKGHVVGFRAPRTGGAPFVIDAESDNVCIYGADGSLQSGSVCPPAEDPILRAQTSIGTFPHGAWFLLRPGGTSEPPPFIDDKGLWKSPTPPPSMSLRQATGVGSRYKPEPRHCETVPAHEPPPA
jgi:hypothetical protein